MRAPVAVGLILGGAIANVLDRAVDGTVVDLIDAAWWPTFNLADMAIVVGVASFVVRNSSLATRHPKTPENGRSRSSNKA